MDMSAWAAWASVVVVLASTAWQIRRDARKDRADQERQARAEAVRQAVNEERLRQLEERERDDD